MAKYFHNAKKLDANGIVDDFWLIAADGIIQHVGSGNAPSGLLPDNVEVVDVGGNWLTPGFIDIHCHGGGGYSFDEDAGSIRSAIKTHRAHGTTRSILSLVANPVSTLCASLELIAELCDSDPTILGSHLEGPFLSEARKGAHNPVYLRVPDSEAIEALNGASRETLRQVTIAPELPEAMEAIDQFVDAGIRVAVGHTDADYATTRSAFDHGATILTHAFNAMNGIHHRAPGPVVAAIDDDRVFIELILDGLHVHPRVADLLIGSSPSRIVLVTDAMAAAGAEDGDYRLGSLNVTVANSVATLSGTDTIAGSTLTLDLAFRNAVSNLQVDPVIAISAMTQVPARALGFDATYGVIDRGFQADFNQFDHTFNLSQTWVSGDLVQT
ncbi:MAG: N-acetylglucosamine-6-phosphate deacetylase [Microbacteriaceae bacterium]|nr:N-acetylglucosamine-6-phosphate deacetylase [Microbacteriaceae bacterium]